MLGAVSGANVTRRGKIGVAGGLVRGAGCIGKMSGGAVAGGLVLVGNVCGSVRWGVGRR